METGAVIVAAGMSSRMGDFKPMLNIGSISIAERVIATLRQAGVERIVVITGYNADLLEHHLAKSHVVFLRNEQYATTQMFDSALIGLEYMAQKCDRMLFTPIDIPLFTASTVEALLKSDAELACPFCMGERGHPILLSSELAKKLLSDSGEGGLKAALARVGARESLIEVKDAGILHDADTPEDYVSLLEYHNSQLVRPVIQVSLAREKPFFDAKIAMLLSLVDETHSVLQACQRMQLSYSSGWNTINTMEAQVGRTLVERSQGGARGGSSLLTEYGRELLGRYRQMEAELKKTAEELFDEYFKALL